MLPLLLESVEEMIGLIEGWPMTILRMLFLEPQTTNNIKTVTAFFYGNGVPVDLAYQLYEACSMMSRTGVKKEVCELYTWFATVKMGVESASDLTTTFV